MSAARYDCTPSKGPRAPKSYVRAASAMSARRSSVIDEDMAAATVAFAEIVRVIRHRTAARTDERGWHLAHADFALVDQFDPPAIGLLQHRHRAEICAAGDTEQAAGKFEHQRAAVRTGEYYSRRDVSLTMRADQHAIAGAEGSVNCHSSPNSGSRGSRAGLPHRPAARPAPCPNR